MTDLVADIYPTVPNDPVKDDVDFWAVVSREIRSRGDVRQTVLVLWKDGGTIDSIMKIVGMTEDEMEGIIPRQLWRIRQWVSCHKCKGTGGHSISVPWPHGNIT